MKEKVEDKKNLIKEASIKQMIQLAQFDVNWYAHEELVIRLISVFIFDSEINVIL